MKTSDMDPATLRAMANEMHERAEQAQRVLGDLLRSSCGMSDLERRRAQHRWAAIADDSFAWGRRLKGRATRAENARKRR